MSASRVPIVVELPDGSFAISFDEQCTVTWKREGETHIMRLHADAEGEFVIKELSGPEGTTFKPLTRN
jgi:hypothetical protein